MIGSLGAIDSNPRPRSCRPDSRERDIPKGSSETRAVVLPEAQEADRSPCKKKGEEGSGFRV